MSKVFIPAAMRSLTDGREYVEVTGATVRGAIQSLDLQFPGIKDYLCQNGELRSGWCIAVGGSITHLGLLAAVTEDSEIHFLPLVGGG